MNTIALPESLRNYLQRLHYEATRYEDLLKTVRRDSCPMTDEEWNSSVRYYRRLYRESAYALSVAKQEVNAIYSDQIQGQNWFVDFVNSLLVVGISEREYIPPLTKRDEPYSEMIVRIFDDEGFEPIALNSSHVKDITIQVTDACNMQCTYCYQHNKGHHSMTFDTAKRFIDMLLDADDATNKYITSTKSKGAIINFIGGEPWLEVDLISKISDYFIGEVFRRKHPWAIRFVFNMSSNGLLHFDPRVQAYLKRHAKHFGYNISIDGNQELHDSCRIDLNGAGTYDRAMRAVYDYRTTFGGRIGSKMTLAPGNIDKLSEAVIHMVNEGYRSINLNCVYEEGWTLDHAKTLYKELVTLTDWLRNHNLLECTAFSIFDQHHGVPMDADEDRNWCGGTGLMLAVDYKGDIFPCLRYMESSVNDKVPPYIIGNICDGISNTAEHCARVDCLACITRRSQSTDECFNCPIARGCGWCSAYNYELYGTPNKRATFICVMHKARSLANVYYWRTRGVDMELHCPQDWALEIISEDEYNHLTSMCGGV